MLIGRDPYEGDLSWRDDAIEEARRKGLPTADLELDRLRRTPDEALKQMRESANAAGEPTDQLEAELEHRRQVDEDWADFPG